MSWTTPKCNHFHSPTCLVPVFVFCQVPNSSASLSQLFVARHFSHFFFFKDENAFGPELEMEHQFVPLPRCPRRPRHHLRRAKKITRKNNAQKL